MVALLAAATLAFAAGPAQAVILPAQTIDGPSEDIVGFGGVAMAEDGTGGLVYLKRVGGVAHVFVAQFIGGHWLAPIQADTGQPFAASWPRIGAANGGQLTVVWATPFATEANVPVDELLGATLGPGAAGFGPATLIDPDVREAAGMNPDLAMSSTGQADVVYRVVNNEGNTNRRIKEFPLLRPGDVVEDVRVAHFNGERWSRLGAINRNAGASMRPPTQANAPQIAIGPTGNGVVVWQEPDAEGVARIWARRLFASTPDFVLPVSAQTFGPGATPIGQDADAPSVAISLLGQAEVAYRQSVGPGSPLPGPRILLNTLPDGESADGSKFEGAKIVDESPGPAGASVGPPSLDVDSKQNVRILYDSNGTPRVVNATDKGLAGALSLGPGFAGSESSASVMNPAGGGISAWPSADARGVPALSVREDFADGAAQTALVRGGAGGPIGELAVGRSGLGDGLIAFLQGQLGNAAIVAARATAPPVQIVLNVPNGWVKPSLAAISWLPAISAEGPLSYRVVLDGHPLATPPGAMRLRPDVRRLSSGRHRVQVLATDIDGQSTLSAPSTLQVDASPPTVRLRRALGGAGVSVRISDAFSGLDKHALSVSFGDGKTARGRATYVHRYARAGTYRVTLHVSSKAGSTGVVRQLVSAR
ncbi:MAG TPA: PKD domain-containing protein [Solirubrobacteraceae bacterium]|nr:PKD domain-containing protein [Solirubrobacteraceae bacterium]